MLHIDTERLDVSAAHSKYDSNQVHMNLVCEGTAALYDQRQWQNASNYAS